MPMSPLRTRFQAYSVLIYLFGATFLSWFAGGRINLRSTSFTCRWPKPAAQPIRWNLDEVASPRRPPVPIPFGWRRLASALATPVRPRHDGALNAADDLVSFGMPWENLSGRVSLLGLCRWPALFLAINGFALAFTGMELLTFSPALQSLACRARRATTAQGCCFSSLSSLCSCTIRGFALAGAPLSQWQFGVIGRAIITGAIMTSAYAALMASYLHHADAQFRYGEISSNGRSVSSRYGIIFGELLQLLASG
jgi:hypothetical protein